MLRTAARLLLSALAVGALSVSMASAPGGAADARGDGGGAPDHTVRVVVRPVTSAGKAADGYTVRKETDSASCTDQSTTAKSRGIDTCYPTALYLPSCWKSRNHSALCLRTVSDKRLVRVHYTGRFRTQAVVRRPSPQGLTLTNGAICQIRIGGAWGTAPGHPNWLGFYSCSNGSVYGPADGDGIDRSQPVWRVHILRADGSIATRKVARATYVGTAS